MSARRCERDTRAQYRTLAMRPAATSLKTLAHASDLHFGLSARAERTAAALCHAFLDAHVDHVVVTGDVTHRGRAAEWQRFREAFAPLLDAGRLTVIPGNHDRLGDDVARAMMTARVEVEERDGAHIVKLDSTGPHNKRLIDGHGAIDDHDLAAVDAALSRAPRGALVVLCLHHHVLPLPMEGVHESFMTWVGMPNARELARGRELLEVVRGRCDLVLHGHKHAPAAWRIRGGARPMLVLNAGSSTELGRARVFAHDGAKLMRRPVWLAAEAHADSDRVLPWEAAFSQ
jgi:3',5'-cyclic-AMP phosphodiesterase